MSQPQPWPFPPPEGPTPGRPNRYASTHADTRRSSRHQRDGESREISRPRRA